VSSPRRAARPAPLRIRRARPEDAPRLASIMRAAVRAERGRYPARVLAAWASLPPLYHRWAMTAGGEVRFVAELGSRPVGFAGLRGREVTALFVRPAAAGQGVGARLLARVAAEARRQGARGLVLVAARGAVGFYRACGFRVVRRERAPLPGGLALPSARMARRVG
jgi:putative acetyltransferase